MPAVAPVISSVVNSCSVVFTGASARATESATSRLMLPRKLNLPRSNRTAEGFQFLISSMPRWTNAMLEPSLGAMLNMWLVAARLPAAGMFCTITVGLPGMWRPMWRATSRAWLS